MGVRDYDDLELGVYTQLLNEWDDRHEDPDAVEPPSVEMMKRRDAMLADKGYKVH